MRRVLGLAMVVVMGVGVSAFGAGPTVEGVLGSVMNEETVAVVRVDVTRLDAGGIGKVAEELGDGAVAVGMRQPAARVGKVLGDFCEAFRKAGGRDFYFVVGMEDVLRWRGTTLVVPLYEGSDGAALGKVMASVAGLAVTRVERDRVVILSEDKGFVASPRGDVVAALKGVEAGAIQAVVVPDGEVLKAFAALEPRVGGELAGLSDFFDKGFLGASLVVDGMPGGRMVLRVETRDAGAAAEGVRFGNLLSRTMATAFPAGVVQMIDGYVKFDPGVMEKFFEEATFGAEGNAAVMREDEGGMRSVMAVVVALRTKGAMSAVRFESQMRIKGLILGCQMYAEKHGGEWPEKLEQLVAAGNAKEEQLHPPVELDVQGYVYRRYSAAEINKLTMSALPVVWEEVDGETKAFSVGFADGRVEVFKTKELLGHLQGEIDGRLKGAGTRP